MSRYRKYRISLSADEVRRLEHILEEGKDCRTILCRCRILLAGNETDEVCVSRVAIARAAGVSEKTVTNVLSAYVSGGLEQVLDLKRNPRSDTARCKTDDAGKKAIRELASSPPPDGMKRWSLRLLAKHADERLGICVNKDTIRSILTGNGQL